MENGWEIIGFRDGYRDLVLNDLAPDLRQCFRPAGRGGTVLRHFQRDNPFNFRLSTAKAWNTAICGML